MDQEKPLAQRPIVVEGRSSRVRRALPGVALGAVFISLATLIGIRTIPPEFASSITGLIGMQSDRPDNLSAQERSNLTAEFLARGPVELRRVRLSELNAAIASMALTPAQEVALRADISLVLRASGTPVAERAATIVETERSSVATPAATNAPSAGTADSAPAAVPESVGRPAATAGAPAPTAAPPTPRTVAPRPAPQAAPVAPSPRAAAPEDDVELPLAWLTLWDHRDEDGDIVRVVSEGYSRTVPILNTPVTLAVPVPASGVVNVIGIHDGVGGITVGIQSGATPVLLPVLSVGQVVGVPIVVR